MSDEFPNPALCDCESMGGRFGAHRDECPAAPRWQRERVSREESK